MSGAQPLPIYASAVTRRYTPSAYRTLQPVAMSDEDSLEDSLQDICIDKPRCRLCQFQIQDDESVVAGMFSPLQRT